MKYSELNDFYNIFESDDNLPHYIFEDIFPRVIRDIQKNQEDIVFMAGEKGKYPVMKEDAFSVIQEIVIDNLGFVINELTYIAADLLYRGIINPGDVEWLLKEHFGQDYPNWEDVYPDKIPYEEYDMKGKISSRNAYGDE